GYAVPAKTLPRPEQANSLPNALAVVANLNFHTVYVQQQAPPQAHSDLQSNGFAEKQLHQVDCLAAGKRSIGRIALLPSSQFVRLPELAVEAQARKTRPQLGDFLPTLAPFCYRNS